MEKGIKRIELPNGETMEVAAGSAGRAPGEREESPRAARPLHLCPACDSDLVQPVRWEEAAPDAWAVTLRCPACERLETGVFGQQVLIAFDEELDRGTEALTTELELLCRSNMAEEIDRFARALEADAIQPMDF
jgi:hypothetical protein